MLARRSLSYEIEGFSCDIVVATANTGMGLYRSALVEDGLRSEEPNIMIRSFLWLQWPVFKAGTVEGHVAWLDHPPDHDEDKDKGKAAEGDEPELVWYRADIQDLKPEQFLKHVPEWVASEWLTAILDLNPHWVMRSRGEIEEEKADPAKKKRS